VRTWAAVAVGAALAAAGLAAILAVLLVAAPARPPAAPETRPQGVIRGVNFTSWWHDEYANAEAAGSFEGLAATGVRAVALIATQYQDSPHASKVTADPERTPSDTALAIAATRARARGMSMRLRMLVDVKSGQPRVEIAPARPEAWFASYGERVRHYARLAHRLGADALEIGGELKQTTGARNAGRWRRLVAVAREEFGGRVSYAANWDEIRQITWWDALDEIAVDAWFPVAYAPSPTENDVVAAWQPHLETLSELATRFRRPVVLSELGYSSSAGALIEPWRQGNHYSAEEQVTGLEAAFRALAGRPWLRAIYLWHWNADPTAGGPGDTDHTFQGKPAASAAAAWLRGR
jgi:hypothetical protein